MKNEKLRMKNWGSFVPNTPTGVAFRFGGNVSVLQHLLGEFLLKKFFKKSFLKPCFVTFTQQRKLISTPKME